MQKPFALLVALLFAGGVIAGCGDDGDDSDDASTTSTTEENRDDDQDEDDTGGDVDAFCDQVRVVADSDFGDSIDSEDPDDLRDALEVVEELRDAAPEEIRDTFDDVVEGFELVISLAEQLEDDPELDENDLFEENADELEALGQATDEIDEFTLAECGITVDGDTGDSNDTIDDTLEDLDDLEDDFDVDPGEAGDPTPPPALDDPELAQLAEDCFEGSGEACDELFFATDVGSEEEEYGNTCGGRFDSSPGLCATVIGG